MPCTNCVHEEVCKHKEEYEEFLNQTLSDAFDLAPDFVDIKVNCKMYLPVASIPREVRYNEMQALRD